MKPFALSAAIIAALLASPGLAAPLAAPLAFDGAYQFTTTERENGNPVCTETWTFAAPDRMTVISGEELVEKRFRTENDRDGDWLVARSLATNGKPDCMGNISDPPRPERSGKPHLDPALQRWLHAGLSAARPYRRWHPGSRAMLRFALQAALNAAAVSPCRFP